jgi:hypothetical protein
MVESEISTGTPAAMEIRLNRAGRSLDEPEELVR